MNLFLIINILFSSVNNLKANPTHNETIQLHRTDHKVKFDENSVQFGVAQNQFFLNNLHTFLAFKIK